ncbi:hypothetical protein G6F57_010585 [Rhizopus arrhizus]|uniref:VHS domain-containing protein n=1 Tax=Rhizopus oryzae TaxID=64495 RepID=A0A9P7BSU3_RHIOR|nr:hypothetical protein G6F23_006125 [Rhizopus arrhizus]KAG0761781.1 hypothetical protein G6F24_007305 [Rhizopus arrhizus]KAG0779994.1 hypothetical protein G6F21_012338 [Rhizopus arrhizus]KAG0809319.1 hypothetical protein G6F20_008871 [Rhizopus arrhizus]KAG0820751.1 hypothetical protein G6F18_012485 [Rhizopus arrhizus]
MFLFSKKVTPTEITTKIDQAVDEQLGELDWNRVFEICQLVNQNELGAKEARKQLQKKLMSSQPRLQVMCLEVLNALIENDPHTMQNQITAKSFGEDLSTLARSRLAKTLDPSVISKLAEYLDTWSSRYLRADKIQGLLKAREEMVQRISQQRPPREQVEKMDVQEVIEIAKNSAQLLSQTLSFTDPTKEDISKNSLIQEFYAKCKHAQTAIQSRLQQTEDPETTSDLLNANNELLGCFKSYDEMIEQQLMHEAQLNSQSLHHRGTTQVEPQQSSSSQPQAQPGPVTDDPFDPFADDYQVSNGSNLPPPLTPQKLHK